MAGLLGNYKKGDKLDSYRQGGGLLDIIKQNPEAAVGLLADFTPVVGGVKGAYEEGKAGNMGMAAFNAATVPLDLLSFGTGGLAAKAALAGIVSPKLAKTLRTAKKLPDDEIFKAAVENTKGASITDDGLLMSLQRNQKPDQALKPSVRGGVFYLPEGSANAKHYSGTGMNIGYGGTEKITGETLISNPLFVKGATGGKAPEVAYDSIHGKGAYQAMRNDALQASGVSSLSRGITEQDKIERIAETLSQYGADPSLAEHILKNSTKGNQLPYAIQEAIVAASVREAGHDAVLGYSKGKAGPFLSEVFDVREMRYPDKFGTEAQVWPEYQSSLLNTPVSKEGPRAEAMRIAQANAAPQGLLDSAPMSKPALDYQIEHKPMTVEGGAALLHDLEGVFGPDIYGRNALQYFGSGLDEEKRILKLMQAVKGNPDAPVKIYRGVPQSADKINAGDWVTLDRKAAEYYTDPSVVGGTERGKIIEMTVPARHITSWPDSLAEFGYFPD